MKIRRLAALLLSFTFILCGCNNGDLKTSNKHKQLTTKQKVEDFEYLYTILKENYPYFQLNKRVNNVDWLLNKEKYEKAIKETKSDEEFFNCIKEALKDLHNGHTNILNSEGYFLFKDMFKNIPPPNQTLDILTDKRAVERYGETQTNKEEDSQLNADHSTKDNVTTTIVEKDKTAYLGVKSFNNINMNNQEFETIYRFLKDIKDYKTLIIDIRGNGGGNESYWRDYIVAPLINEPLMQKTYCIFRGGSYTQNILKSTFGNSYDTMVLPIDKLKKENLSKLPQEIFTDFKYYLKNIDIISPKGPVGFKGKIYLLVDERVYSSSEGFAIFAKSTGFATVVGEKTGGDGIGISPTLGVLPNSGYVFRYPQEMGLKSDGSSDEEFKTEPDIKVDAKKSSSLMEDPAVKKVLELTK
ncbi:S41 family peptidase [Clostridium sp. YIM B02515]|uniref:S41 family peptidase n=1 Tax=Clostridium rhizosphaerae TaxID=2803861 RepID=A0ABS1TG61_9CLOT|nr:S41 family peptidase [Clostridium rhizosphaerae]MBL4936953.1 S41 family peptidase [Clostridium rhizosphaerae]